MVRNNNQLENAKQHIDRKIDELLQTKKVIDGILNDLNKANFPEVPPFAEPMATVGSGVVPAADLFLEPNPPQVDAERGILTSPLCKFYQGDYETAYCPQSAEVESLHQTCKRISFSILNCLRRAFRRLRQAV